MGCGISATQDAGGEMVVAATVADVRDQARARRRLTAMTLMAPPDERKRMPTLERPPRIKLARS